MPTSLNGVLACLSKKIYLSIQEISDNWFPLDIYQWLVTFQLKIPILDQSKHKTRNYRCFFIVCKKLYLRELPMNKADKSKQLEADKKFIKMADYFIEEANQQCDENDHQLVNASLLYAAARFSSFITASLAESKENFEAGTDEAIAFYVEEFEKMLKEHMRQYKSIFDKRETPPYPY